MILITILALTVLMCIIGVIVALSIGGTFMIITCGDVIVCVIFIVLFIRWLIKRRRGDS